MSQIKSAIRRAWKKAGEAAIGGAASLGQIKGEREAKRHQQGKPERQVPPETSDSAGRSVGLWVNTVLLAVQQVLSHLSIECSAN